MVFEGAAVMAYLMVVEILDMTTFQGALKPYVLTRAYIVDGIQRIYRETLSQVKFSGPTLFEPLLKRFKTSMEANSGSALY